MEGTVRRRGRPPKAEAGDTKGALLRAAMKLFAENGYAGTSIRAIAREVGLSESVLYAHFTNKREIFDAALAAVGPVTAISLAEGLDPDDPPAFLRALVDRMMSVWESPQARQMISMAAHDGLLHDPALIDAILGALTRFRGLFAGWIDAGLVPAELGTPDDLAYALASPLAQARVLWMHSGSTPEEITDARRRATRHVEFFIRAVFEPVAPSAGAAPSAAGGAVRPAAPEALGPARRPCRRAAGPG